MASAAAVAANSTGSPLGNNIGEGTGEVGEITSGIYSKNEGLPDINGNVDSDEDEDLPTNPLRGSKSRRHVTGGDDSGEDDDMGLFGDEEGADTEPKEPARRQLDDEELDFGDDMERMDRVGDEQEQEPEQEMITQEKVTMDLELPRQPIPEPSDGEMYLLKMPSFMAIEPRAWDQKTFQPPTTDHHSNQKPTATFSPFNTAITTIRWRRSPNDQTELQSNARINRWSDGSLTVQLASDPSTQYEIDGNALAPPQRNPVKPTPTSIQLGTKGGRHGAALDEKYDQSKDAFTYLMRPHHETGSMIVAHKITSGLTIKQSDSVEDDAIERLQASLAAASNASKVNGASGLNLIQVEEDPELAKAKALEAMRQKEKGEKRRQAALDRETARSDRVLGRSGLGADRMGGLNVGMLEDDEGDGSGRRGRPSPNKRPKPRRRRGSEYSSDENDRRFREDSYDHADNFLAPSDEEEIVESDSDPDEGIVEEPDSRRERTPKRERPPPTDDEADAPGELDEEAVTQQARTKRRKVVEDEDEDE